MRKQSVISKSVAETKKFAGLLAESLIPRKKGAVVIGLEGNLGSGKTTFAQGFAKGLGIKEKILSPTFVILKKFKIRNSKFNNFYHIDCYRLRGPKELLALGWEEIIANPKNIVIVEWAERVKKILPKDTLWASLEHAGQKKRKITIH